jgi:hypothetical protein
MTTKPDESVLSVLNNSTNILQESIIRLNKTIGGRKKKKSNKKKTNKRDQRKKQIKRKQRKKI